MGKHGPAMSVCHAKVIVVVIVLLLAHDALWFMGVDPAVSYAMVVGAGVASGKWVYR